MRYFVFLFEIYVDVFVPISAPVTFLKGIFHTNRKLLIIHRSAAMIDWVPDQLLPFKCNIYIVLLLFFILIWWSSIIEYRNVQSIFMNL